MKTAYIYTVLYTSVTLMLYSCNKKTDFNNNNNNNSNQTNLTDTTIKNVSYGSHPRQVYDIFLPKKRNANTPLIIMIHGGAWKSGQKEDLYNYMALIKAKWDNVALATINYRYASNTNGIHHNQIMSDINSVVNHIIANKSSYNISSKIGMFGSSAGGQLAMIYSYKYNNSIKCVGNIFGPSIISDWSWYNSTNIWVGAYIGDILTEYVGQPWNTAVYNSVSPYWNVTASSQPTIIFHGNLDPVVPVYQSQWMHAKLNNLGVVNQYHEYLAFHSFDNSQSDDVATKIVAFFKPYLQ